MFTSFNARAVGLSLSAVETIELAAAAGFAGVDLLIRDLLDAGDDPKAVRIRMDDLGLRPGAFPLPVAWRGDAEKFASDVTALPRLAEAASVLGLTRTGTWVMPETPGCPESEAEIPAYLAAVSALHIERLGTIARVLDQHGIQFGIEVLGVESLITGRGLPFVRRMCALDARLGGIWGAAGNLGILVDGFHLYAAGETIDAALAWGVERVVWVHVADLPASACPDRRAIRDDDRGLPGENGAIDNTALLRRLQQEGYRGPVTAEPMAGCRSLAGINSEAVARKVATALKVVWPTSSG